jgi:integrase/recombinase XerC
MRGQGNAYRPWTCRAPDVTAAHKRTRKKEPPYCAECEQSPAYMLDYTVNNKRYRESSGATDYQEALRILGKRREDRRTGRPVTDSDRPVSTGLWAYALEYIERKAGKVSERWHENVLRHLERAAAFFCPEMPLAAITPRDVRRWDEHLQQPPPGKRKGLSGGPRRHHLNTLSNLYAYAREDGVVPSGFNPVADLNDKPQAPKRERDFFQVPEAALFLDAAKRYEPKRDDLAVPFAYELVATLLLTGGRPSEVTGLDIADIDFDRETVRIRGTKTDGSDRTISLWPQLARILRRYIGTRRTGLLFPNPRTGRPMTDIRKLLNGVAAAAGLVQHITPYITRHTYCAARLQTLDGDAPISPYTVGKELGHSGDALVRRVYGHLGTVRPRSAVVEYPTERVVLRVGRRMFATRAERRVA